MVFQKKGDKKTDEKKLKKASLSQVVRYLNDNSEDNDKQSSKSESDIKDENLPATKLKSKTTEIIKKGKSEKQLVKREKPNKAKQQIVHVEESSSHELVHVSSSSAHEMVVKTKGTKKNKKQNKEGDSTVTKGDGDLQLEDEEQEEYSKKKIRQAQVAKKREEKKRISAKVSDDQSTKEREPKEGKKNIESTGEEQITKRTKRATAVQPSVDTGKKLTRKERKDLKIRNKGAGVSSKEFVRLLKEGENKDLKDVPFEGSKGIMQLPTRTKADAIARKPLRKAKGPAVPRGRTRTAPKKKKKD